MKADDGIYIEDNIPSRIVFRMVVVGIAIGFLLLMIVCAGLPSIETPESVKRTICANNLRQIALALHSYHDAHGQFPPAYTTDDSGNRLHSWRVLVLPYLESGALYEAIDLEKPWDHPDNVQFHNRMPDVFRCPRQINPKTCLTSYLSVVGPELFWDEFGKTRTRADVTDGHSNTLCLIEADSHPINWMSPHHYTWNDLIDFERRGVINELGDPRKRIVGGHRGLGVCVYVNGATEVTRSDILMKELYTRLTHASGEAME